MSSLLRSTITTAKKPKPEPSLEQLQTEAVARINSQRTEAISSGVSYGGNVFDSDPVSRDNLTGVVTAVLAGIPLPEGFTWRTADNKDVPMTTQNLVELSAAMLQHVNAQYQKSWQLKARIIAASSNEAVEGVTW